MKGLVGRRPCLLSGIPELSHVTQTDGAQTRCNGTYDLRILFKKLKTSESIIFSIKGSRKVRSREYGLLFLPHNFGDNSFSWKKRVKKNHPKWKVNVCCPTLFFLRCPSLSHFWYRNVIRYHYYATWVILSVFFYCPTFLMFMSYLWDEIVIKLNDISI